MPNIVLTIADVPFAESVLKVKNTAIIEIAEVINAPIIKVMINDVNEIYLDKFKTKKGYKNMTKKRQLEFSDYIAFDTEYERELKELQYVLDNLENESC